MALSDPKLSSFVHAPLDDPTEQFRLFRFRPHMTDAQALEKTGSSDIFGSLTVFDLDKCPPYYALSYEWGSDQDLATIRVNGSSLEIRRNLYEFFRTMRGMTQRLPFESTGDIYLWVDQLSINQTNVHERNHQVSLMRIIYENADAVIAWLGTGGSLLEPSFLQSQAHGSFADSLDAEQRNEVILSLASSGYWDRLWVIQELLLAKSVTVTFGWQSWLFDSLYPNDVLQPVSTFITGVGTISSRILSIEDVLYVRKYMRTESAILSLSSALLRYGKKQCSDPRDKLYALLGFVHGKGLNSDYSLSPSEVFALIVKTVFADMDHFMVLEPVPDFQRSSVSGKRANQMTRCLTMVGMEMGLSEEAVVHYVQTAMEETRQSVNNWTGSGEGQHGEYEPS